MSLPLTTIEIRMSGSRSGRSDNPALFRKATEQDFSPFPPHLKDGGIFASGERKSRGFISQAKLFLE
jgi:hypothetical protein